MFQSVSIGDAKDKQKERGGKSDEPQEPQASQPTVEVADLLESGTHHHEIHAHLRSLANVSLMLKYECLNIQKLARAFLSAKEAIIRRLAEIERLLLLVDRKMYQERKNLVKLLQYVGGGIEGRETNIKDLLKEIASLEMKKSDEEDRLSE